MDMRYLTRNVNEGFSGGEKKRNEILQARARARCAAPQLWCCLRCSPLTHVRSGTAGGAGGGNGYFGRDRLWPRHRRAPRRLRRGQRPAQAGPRGADDHALPGACAAARCSRRCVRRVWRERNADAASAAAAQRLLDYIEPDFVHVMIEGKIVQTGGKARGCKCRVLGSRVSPSHVGCAAQELASQLELSGYAEMGR